MRNYELLFILNPMLDDESKSNQIESVKGIINAEGEVLDVDEWGNRELAYEIQKRENGYYVLVNFKAEPDMPKELDRRLKIADSVMRHIIVCKDEK